MGYNKSDIENLSYKVSDINYSKKLYTLELDKINLDTFVELIYTKSDKWIYENECRAIYELKEEDVEHFPIQLYYQICNRKNEGHLNNYIFETNWSFENQSEETICSQKRIFCKCKPVKIYLGSEIEKEDMKKLVIIADKLNIEIYRMTKSQHSFELIPQKVDPEFKKILLQASQPSN